MKTVANFIDKVNADLKTDYGLKGIDDSDPAERALAISALKAESQRGDAIALASLLAALLAVVITLVSAPEIGIQVGILIFIVFILFAILGAKFAIELWLTPKRIAAGRIVAYRIEKNDLKPIQQS